MRVRVKGKDWFETDECKWVEVWINDHSQRFLYMTPAGNFLLCEGETRNPEQITKEDAIPLIVDAVNSNTSVPPEIQAVFQEYIDTAWPVEHKL